MWCGQRPQLGGADIDKTKNAHTKKPIIYLFFMAKGHKRSLAVAGGHIPITKTNKTLQK
jgi:hypothetical protein